MEIDINRVLLHLSEMLLDRGEDISELVEHADAVPRPRYLNEVIELSTDRTMVLFAMTKELVKRVVKDMEDLEEFVERYGKKNFVVVIQEITQPATAKVLQQRDKELLAQGGMFQVFLAKELSYNPTKHELVPRHEKLGEQEAREVLDRYLIKSRAKMPIIHRTDIQARWLGLRQGDIVRITRHNDTSGEYYYYRCCM